MRRPEERKGRAPIDKAEMADFNNCIMDIQVVEMNCVGLPFTWDNKSSDGDNIMSRIDRASV